MAPAWSPGDSPLQHIGPLLVLASLPLLPALLGTEPVPGRLGWTRSIAPDEEAFDEARAGLRARTADELDTLAQSCQKQKAYLQRDLTYGALLKFDPDHAKARKYLGYKLDRKTKTWERPRAYKAPRDKDHAAALELLEARAALLAGHTDRLLALLEEHQGDLPKARFQQEVDELLDADPDSERLRAMVGQVKIEVDGQTRWMSRATALTMTQRKEQRAAWDKARSDAPDPTPAEAEEFETQLGVEFSGVAETEHYRVLASSGKGEAEEVARRLEALTTWMHPLLGTRHSQGQVRLYLMSIKAGEEFTDSFPGIAATDRLRYKGINGAWMASSERLGVWNGSRESRLDQAMRLIVSYALLDTYGRTEDGTWVKGGMPGWIEQGLGIYLVWQMAGTKLSLQLKDRDSSASGRPDYISNLRDEDANWISLARRMMNGKRKPSFAISLGKDAMAMESDDLLLAYAVSAWLVEGHEQEVVHRILARCGQREATVKVLEEELGMPVPRLEAALTAWLDEVRK